MQGMQNQQAQQGRLTSMLGQQGQYQEQGRQEFNRDVAALTGAKRQQWFDAAKGAAMVGATIATGGLAGAGAAGAGAAGAAGAGAAGKLTPAMLKMLMGGI
jgi:predicted phage tail protein